MTDLYAILWKEWNELFHQRQMRGAIFNWAVMVGLAGIFMPIQSGDEWLTNPFLLIVWSWLPLLAVIQVVADTFAGERERHTLETLLASRLPDRTILSGKILSVVLYGWSIQTASMLLGAVTANLVAKTGGIRFYSAEIIFGLVPVSYLLVVLAAALGTLVSLRSATMRQAYQKMSIFFMALIFIPFLGSQIFPEVAHVIAQMGQVRISLPAYWSAAAGLLALNSAVIAIGVSRFQRQKLVAEG